MKKPCRYCRRPVASSSEDPIHNLCFRREVYERKQRNEAHAERLGKVIRAALAHGHTVKIVVEQLTSGSEVE